MKMFERKLGGACIEGAIKSVKTEDTREQTLEEIIDGFIDENPIVYERLSKL